MRVLIRCDVGGTAGMGHAVRMRALAQALAARGADVVFLTQTEALQEFVAPFLADFFRECEPAYHPMLESADVIVIDHKASDLAWYKWAEVPLVAIDKPDVDPFLADLCVAPCAHWSPATVTRLHAAFGARFLSGWDYVMLDPAVTSQPPIPYGERQDGPIVLCAGGSDPDGALAKMWQWTLGLPPEIESRLVFMVGALQHDTLSEAMQTLGTAPGVHMPDDRLLMRFNRELLRRAALVIGFLGLTMYETIWWQTPMLCFARTESDYEALLRLEWECAHRSIGALSPLQSFWWGRTWDGEGTSTGFCDRITTWWQDRAIIGQQYGACAPLIDGRGVERVAEAILRLGTC